MMKKKKRRNKQKGGWLLKLGKIILVLFITLFLFIFGSYFVFRSVAINHNETKNILIVSDDLAVDNKYLVLVHLAKDDESTVIFFDANSTVKVSEQYGEYRLGSVHQLLKIDQQAEQKETAIFSHIFNLVINEVVVANQLTATDFKQSLINSSWQDKQLSLVKLWLQLDQFKVIKLPAINQLDFDGLATIDRDISANCSVAIVNTTKVNGVAQRLSNLLEHTGVQVVQLESVASVLEKTSIYSDDNPACEQLINGILTVFPELPEQKVKTALPLTQHFRSAVVIVLGSNY